MLTPLQGNCLGKAVPRLPGAVRDNTAWNQSNSRDPALLPASPQDLGQAPASHSVPVSVDKDNDTSLPWEALGDL